MKANRTDLAGYEKHDEQNPRRHSAVSANQSTKRAPPDVSLRTNHRIRPVQGVKSVKNLVILAAFRTNGTAPMARVLLPPTAATE